MHSKTDFELIEILKTIRASNEEEIFIKNYTYETNSVPFCEFLQNYITHNRKSVADVMNNSRINKNYGYNIINGTRKRPGRDKVLALCIGAGMSLEQVQEALKSAEQPPLDPRNERDVRIAVAINNNICDVMKLNLKLEDKGVEPLQV